MSSALRGTPAALPRQAMLRALAAFALGGALNLAFAPYGWWPLAILAPAALFAILRGVPPSHAGRIGASFGLGLFALGTYWLYTCLHVFGLVPVWLTLLLQAVLIVAMAAYSAALGYLANRFWPQAGVVRELLVLPALWLLLEWLRGWVLTGFPWLSLGYALIDSPLAGWAPVLGVYGVTLAGVVAAGALNLLLAPDRAAPRRWGACAVLAAVTALPLLAFAHPWTVSSGAPIPIAAVQGAVSQDQKWQEENRKATMTRYMSLTQRAWGARLIVWPESAVPVLAPEIPNYLHALAQAGREHGADFAIGLVDYWPASNIYHNGLLIMSSEGSGWYYKRHLVPFGEYFPVPAFIRSWMRLMSLPYDDISPGADRQPVLNAAGQNLGLTICYEDAFGSSQLAVLAEATLLINVTNNAWYGNSTAPHQHLQISRMRALEAGRYLIRAANDGITAVIDEHGRVTAQLPQFKEGVLRAPVQPFTGLTPYARFGNYPVVSLSFACLCLAAWDARRRSFERCAAIQS